MEPEFVRGSIELCPDPANFVPFVRQRSGPKHDAPSFLAQLMLFRAQTMPTHDALLTLTLHSDLGLGSRPFTSPVLTEGLDLLPVRFPPLYLGAVQALSPQETQGEE